jgi:hypothetical protein
MFINIKFIYIIYFLVFFSPSLKAQKFACDSLSKSVIEELNSYSKTEFEKLVRYKKIDPKKAYNIATYFRLNKDTSYLFWYTKFIQLVQKEISHNNLEYMTVNYKNKLGISYYFSERYHEACLYLASSSQKSCLYNYYKNAYSITNRDSVDWIDIIKIGKFENITQLDSNFILKFPNWTSKGKSKQLLGSNRYCFFAVKFQNYSIIRYDYNAGRYMANLCFFIKSYPNGDVLLYNINDEINTFEALKEQIIQGKVSVKRWNYLSY